MTPPPEYNNIDNPEDYDESYDEHAGYTSE